MDLTPKDVTKRYIISSAHRRSQPHKSRWIVSATKEVNCFIDSDVSGWTEVDIAWGIILENNTLLSLGRGVQNDMLKVAKFVGINNVWHGYPADYLRNHQDRPSMKILQIWREKGIIEKHQVVKIRQGKECNL